MEEIKIGDLKITEIAPVLIPTLNRSKHLINLLTSLSRCTLSDKTEVYVAVDYPTKDFHWKGYNEIIDFLDSSGDFGFKKLHVVKRERNYGFGKNGNMPTLISQIAKRHSRYIFTEDDNEFAPSFLEFMNYNLEKYKNDSSIFSICGYMYILNNNYNDFATTKLSHYSAWGAGHWVNKTTQYRNVAYNTDQIKLLLGDQKLKNYFKKYKKGIYNALIGMSKGRPILGDSLITAYQIHNDMKSIFPTISLVRNLGWDGSGLHGGVRKEYLNQKIYDIKNINFNKNLDDNQNIDLDLKISNFLKLDQVLIQRFLSFLTFYIYQIFGKYVEFSFFRKIWKKYIRHQK